MTNDDKMHIHRLPEQGFGAKAIRASYPDKNWSLNMLKTICHRVDEMGSVVMCAAGSGRMICRKRSWIQQSHSHHLRAHFDHMLLQLVDIFNTLVY